MLGAPARSSFPKSAPPPQGASPGLGVARTARQPALWSLGPLFGKVQSDAVCLTGTVRGVVCNSCFLQGVGEKGVQREGEPSGESSPPEERHWRGRGVNPWPLPKPAARVIYTRGVGGTGCGQTQARYSEQGKESIWGGGAVLCPGSFHRVGKEVQKEGTALKDKQNPASQS